MATFKVGEIVKTERGNLRKILAIDAPGEYPVIAMNTITGDCAKYSSTGKNAFAILGNDLIPPIRVTDEWNIGFAQHHDPLAADDKDCEVVVRVCRHSDGKFEATIFPKK